MTIDGRPNQFSWYEAPTTARTIQFTDWPIGYLAGKDMELRIGAATPEDCTVDNTAHTVTVTITTPDDVGRYAANLYDVTDPDAPILLILGELYVDTNPRPLDTSSLTQTVTVVDGVGTVSVSVIGDGSIDTAAEVVALFTGTPGATKFLRSDGTLAVPAGGTTTTITSNLRYTNTSFPSFSVANNTETNITNARFDGNTVSGSGGVTWVGANNCFTTDVEGCFDIVGYTEWDSVAATAGPVYQRIIISTSGGLAIIGAPTLITRTTFCSDTITLQTYAPAVWLPAGARVGPMAVFQKSGGALNLDYAELAMRQRAPSS